jgi:tRNA dimethylallyltransferase
LKSFISPKIIFIVGATAVGKTDVALEIAKHLPCEIVSCDAMQVYQDVSIASSKPTLDERKAVVHHVLDMVSVEKKFDVSLFNQAARSAIDKILKSQKYPLVVGGSGMYMQVLLDGIFEVGGQDVSVRKKLEDRLMQEGAETLYAELQSVDPQAAAKIHVQDTRRIVRALEVFQITQVPISQLQKKRSGLWQHYPVVVFGLNRLRTELYQRINARVERMWEEGLLEEVRAIKDRSLSLTAQRIIGVREVLDYLQGRCDLQKAKELMKMNTRRLAKRQLTWFRKDQRIHWLAIDQKDDAAVVAQKILKEMNSI